MSTKQLKHIIHGVLTLSLAISMLVGFSFQPAIAHATAPTFMWERTLDNEIFNELPDAISEDLDGDGNNEIVFMTLSTTANEFLVRIIDSTGTDFAPWPTLHLPSVTGTSDSTLSVGDVNGDGEKDIILLTMDPTGTFTLIKLFNYDGTPLGIGTISNVGEWPWNLRPNVALSDFNNDGKLDLAIRRGYGLSPHKHFYVTVYDYLGNVLIDREIMVPPPTIFEPYVEGTIAVADIDGNGTNDIVGTIVNQVIGAPGGLFIANASGVTYRATPRHRQGMVTLVDLNFDHKYEIAFVNFDDSRNEYYLTLYSSDGVLLWKNVLPGRVGWTNEVSVGNINAQSPELELIIETVNPAVPSERKIVAFSYNGLLVSRWPVMVHGWFNTFPTRGAVTANIDQSCATEFFTSNQDPLSRDTMLQGFKADGSPIPGYPLLIPPLPTFIMMRAPKITIESRPSATSTSMVIQQDFRNNSNPIPHYTSKIMGYGLGSNGGTSWPTMYGSGKKTRTPLDLPATTACVQY